ncbi:hypothetical protein GCM10011609_35430 [Lentzea pudingi]|uniref:VOC domain-containing protein n=1 Tax=Lentzea pudingi TaxID=1789439 RepID=A0ABQ2HXV8_9PSEU|nr:bleomycin resistance protein [Lentzea pudingi]GGM94867.1 hypothetical protein GCM10011609_35430 [Lentzea pudingi]
MSAERIATMIPADDLAGSVALWSALLGVPPTFVDGDRWAQFDVAGGRLALAGTDRVHDGPAVLVRVPDLERAHASAKDSGLEVGPITEGPHELRCVVTVPDGTAVVLHGPRSS